METLLKTISCFGVILEDNQTPPRIYLVHNTADPLGPNGEEGKPDGWGLPGGGSNEGEKPYEAVIREVLGEAGLLTEISKRGKNSEFGEILFENKPFINKDLYIFHLKKINTEGFRNIEETGETGRVMLADLGSILKMPLAVKVIKLEDNTTQKIKNPEGIYFSTRERIVGVLEYLGYDFYTFIPDLYKIIKEISREEVGSYIYDLLTATVEKKNETREALPIYFDPTLKTYWVNTNYVQPDLDELLERYKEIIAG